MPSYIDDGPSVAIAGDNGSFDPYEKKSFGQGMIELTQQVKFGITAFLDFISLVELDLSHCELTNFPTHLLECKSLQSLNMSHNNLVMASCNLSLFPNLTSLDLFTSTLFTRLFISEHCDS